MDDDAPRNLGECFLRLFAFCLLLGGGTFAVPIESAFKSADVIGQHTLVARTDRLRQQVAA